MIVQCPSCSSKYRVNDEKIPAKGARISCPSCSHKFVVYRESEHATPARSASPLAAASGSFSEDDDDVPTTVMPHGSQLAREIRAAADRARADDGFTPTPPPPSPGRPVPSPAKAAPAEGSGVSKVVVGLVVIAFLVVCAFAFLGRG